MHWEAEGLCVRRTRECFPTDTQSRLTGALDRLVELAEVREERREELGLLGALQGPGMMPLERQLPELHSETRAHLGQNHVPAIRDDSHGVRGGLEVGEARCRKHLHLGGTLADLAAMPKGWHR